VPPELAAAAWQEVARQDAQRLAQLVQDVEADGVFLDTMSAISQEFRTAIDRARPGVVFCSEGRAKGKAFETITGSWDQSPNRDGPQGNWSASPEMMPGVDLWRFLFPEHRLFVISRHAVGDDRLRIIQRGFFNGMGWVVWQDIFGLVLSYAPEEAALLRTCATLLRQHRSALWCSRPAPLVETLTPGVYANEFPGETKRLWTFYNANDTPVEGQLRPAAARPGHHFVDIWQGRELTLDAQGRLAVTLAARAVGAVVEFPRLIRCAAGEEAITLRDEVDASLVVRWQGETRRPVELGRATSLPALRRLQQTPCIVQAVKEGEVLDQIVVPLG
jgi:hypothetical protein